MTNADIIRQKFGDVFEDDLIEYLAKDAIVTPVLEGNKLIKRGTSFQYIVLLLDGTMKVSRTDEESGQEHLLFYLSGRDSCAATFVLCNNKFNISEIDMKAETDSMVLLIPRNKMNELLANFKSWRDFVLETFGEKIKEFLDTLDSITFMKLDERLIRYLRDRAKVLNTNELEITHQEIANDLTTSRVVISRLLKILERDGHIRLHRNLIELVDL